MFFSGHPIDFSRVDLTDFRADVNNIPIDNFDDHELDQYLPTTGSHLPGTHVPEQYTSCYGQSPSSTTPSAWSGTYRMSSGICLPPYSVPTGSDVSSPYDLSNHSPQNNQSHSPSMHSPSYQSNTNGSTQSECKYSSSSEDQATVKLEPLIARQLTVQQQSTQGVYGGYNVSPPRYESNHQGNQFHSSFGTSATQPYPYMPGVSRQMFNPPIPAAVSADQSWNRFT